MLLRKTRYGAASDVTMRTKKTIVARRLSHPGLISTAKNSTLQAFSVNWPAFCIKCIYRYYHIKIFL